MIENSLPKLLLYTGLFLLGGCVRTPEPEPPTVRPPVGIVRSVSLAERYLVFEAEYRMPAGRDMRVLREGHSIGRVRAGSERRRRFQSADILEGRPQIGDLVEPVSLAQPQTAQ